MSFKKVRKITLNTLHCSEFSCWKAHCLGAHALAQPPSFFYTEKNIKELHSGLNQSCILTRTLSMFKIWHLQILHQSWSNIWQVQGTTRILHSSSSVLFKCVEGSKPEVKDAWNCVLEVGLGVADCSTVTGVSTANSTNRNPKWKAAELGNQTGLDSGGPLDL